MLAPPAVPLPLRGGHGGHCRYPADQVPPIYSLDSKTRKTYYHMPYNARSYLPAWEGSDATTCPAALDPASLLERALMLPLISRLWILPPYSRGLQHSHVSSGSESYLPAREGSDAAMCPTAPDPASLLGRALVLPHDPWHRTPPPYLGGFWLCHTSYGSLWATDIKNKERLSCPTYAARLMCFQGMPAHY
jgi:hypothetical protein